VEKCGRATEVTDDNIIGRTRFASSIPNAKDTQSECVVNIYFPRQQWLHVDASMLSNSKGKGKVIPITGLCGPEGG